MKKFFIGIVTILIIILFLWLQVNFFNYIKFFNVIPNIGIILIISIGICSGKNIGLASGFIYGLLFDSVCSSCFGVFTFVFSIIGFVSGMFKGNLSLDNKYSLVIMTCIATIFLELFNVLMLYILHRIDFSVLFFIRVLFLEIIYNVFLASILFKPLTFWGEIINKSRRAYYEL